MKRSHKWLVGNILVLLRDSQIQVLCLSKTDLPEYVFQCNTFSEVQHDGVLLSEIFVLLGTLNFHFFLSFRDKVKHLLLVLLFTFSSCSREYSKSRRNMFPSIPVPQFHLCPLSAQLL